MSNNKDPNYELNLINLTYERRKHIRLARNALFWAGINCGFIFLLLIDLYFGLVRHYFSLPLLCSISFYLEILSCFLFTLYAIYDVFLHLWLKFWMQPIELNCEQRRLLGVQKDEIGFSEQKITVFTESDADNLKRIKRAFPFRTNDSPLSPIHWFNRHTSNTSSYYTSTPSNVGKINSYNSSLNLTGSWKLSANNSLSSTFEDNGNNSSKRMSSSRIDTSIKDEDSLKKYLKDFDEKIERISQMDEIDKYQGLSQMNVSLQKPKIDLTDMNYQPSNDSMVINNVDQDDSCMTGSNSRSIDMICSRLEITPAKLNQWTENIRTWISQTILNKLVKDIDKINESLSKASLVDSFIGEVGLSSVRQLSTLKSTEIPAISMVLPYLELTMHQEYLVKRLRDLAKGSCISDYNWKSGGTYKGKRWSEELPSDAQIVMHCFCVYMNSRLPSHPSYPEAKTFTGQYFRQSPVKSTNDMNLHILRVTVYPSHYKVVLKEDDIINIPSGRNNVFYSIIIFLYYIKHKHHGFLGRVNLGPSGVNILWTIEP